MPVRTITPHLKAIRAPRMLRSLPGWLLWRFEQHEGERKPRKVPYYAGGGRRFGKCGTPEDCAKLVTFEAAVASAQRKGFDGVGFAPLGEFGVMCLDFDNCFRDGELLPEVEAMVAGTYAEFSPSGHGVRAFVRATGHGNRKSATEGNEYGLELFSDKGFVTFTGNVLDICTMLGCEDDVSEPNADLLAVIGARFARRDIVAGEQRPTGMTEAQLREAVASLPNDLHYDEWLRVGMALHHETDGAGFDIWLDWSRKSPKHSSDEYCEAKWDSFGRNVGGDVATTVRSLLMLARNSGWVEDTSADFEGVQVHVDPAERQRPQYRRVPKTGEIIVNVGNVMLALQDEAEIGMRIGFDEFRDEIMFSVDQGANWVAFGDQHYVHLRLRLEQLGFGLVGRELVRDVVHAVAMGSRFDTARLWIERLTWDGTPRVASFMTRYLGCEANDYTRAVSLYTWTALAGRVLKPGCKADMVPVLYGQQGAGKSRAAEAMAPCAEFFTEISLGDKDADLSRKMRGKLVAELAELRGLRTREIETIKAFITRTHEDWTPKFKEFNTTFPRRLVFIGTTNDEHFLADPTGNRRWLPLRVGQVDADAIKRDRDQLWAEAVRWFNDNGVMFKDAERLARDVHADHTMTDSWEETIRDWLNTPGFDQVLPSARDFLRVGDVLTEALQIPAKAVKRSDELRVAAILRVFGYERKKMRVDGAVRWVFVPQPAQQ